MSTSNFYGARANSGGKISFDHRPHFRNPCQHSSSSEKSKPKIAMSINELKNLIPSKSELCPVFKKGRCYFDENCHFAHGLSEIRQPDLKPVAMEVHASERNGMGKKRGRECYFVASGVVCPYGDRCFYLHKSDQNLGRNYSGLMCSYRNAGDSSSIERRSWGGGRNHDKSILYRKTKLCDKWERFGSCPYGINCTYAHGREELRRFGYYAELLEKGQDSRLMLGTQSSFAGSWREGNKAAIMGCKVPMMVWKISKMSEVYADWVDVGHDSPSSVE